ncbi:MAG: APC family permease [Firmicutes bacterium]|nr:APC family permease [Bacillota bacterium]
MFLRKKLDKQISKSDIFSLALGAIIGWGAFVLPGDLFLSQIGLQNTIIGMSLGALIMIIIEKNYGFMLSKHAVAGGEYAFTYYSFGRHHALICAWFLGLAYISIVPLNATALSLIAKSMFPGLLEKGFLYSIAGYKVYIGEILVASLALVLFAYFNIKGVKIASALQKVMTMFLVGIVFLLLFMVLNNPEIGNSNISTYLGFSKLSIPKILKILTIAPFAYVGFDCIPQAAEELDFSPKKASKLAMLSIIVGCLIYIMLNIITAFAFTQEMILSSKIDWATGDAVELLLGKIGLYSLGISLLMAIVAGINGFYMAASRILFALSRAGAINSWFSELDKKTKTPKNATLFVMAVSLITPWFGRSVLLWVVNMASIGAVIGYLYTSIAAYKLAKKENDKTIKVTGLLGAIFSTSFCVLLLFPGLRTSLTMPSYIALIAWAILGIVFYRKQAKGYKDMKKETLDKLILNKDSKKLKNVG